MIKTAIIDNANKNTDKPVWKETPDYYSPSIAETENGDIAINVGGVVLVAPIQKWHKAGHMLFTIPFRLNADWRYRIGCKVYLFLMHRIVIPLFDWLGRPGYMR